MGRDDLSRASKKLSWLLRHGALEAGLAMDAAGWAAVDDVLRAARISLRELEEVVAKNDKSRLQMEGGRIRAAQGHSRAGVPVTLEALEASWAVHADEAGIWHGTNAGALEGIAREGILPGARTHVHLAEATDSKVGKRAQVDAMLEVCPARLGEAGITVYRSPNGVLLCRFVPVRCIVGLRVSSAAARAAEPRFRALAGLAV